MGFFSDIFSIKEKVWVGVDQEAYQAILAALKQAGIKTEAFKVNQANPQCFGNCAACGGTCGAKETHLELETKGTNIAERIASGEKIDVYTVYVKQKEQDRAKSIILKTLCSM